MTESPRARERPGGVDVTFAYAPEGSGIRSKGLSARPIQKPSVEAGHVGRERRSHLANANKVFKIDLPTNSLVITHKQMLPDEGPGCGSSGL